MSFIWFLVIGGVAGWLAGLFIKGKGFGIIINIIVGIIGGFLGGWLFKQLKISIGGETIGPLVTAFIGAAILLFILTLIKKK